MLPSGHYSQYITRGLIKTGKVKLLVYTDKDSKNLTIKKNGKIIPTWSKTPNFIFEILKQLKRDNPDIVHYQHELNMYGGIFTAGLFPLLLLLSKIQKHKIIVTIHAAPTKKIIDDDFIKTFNQNPKILRPWVLKVFFEYIYRSIGYFSNQIIVHNLILKNHLVNDYKIPTSKIVVIPAAIPDKKNNIQKKLPYFFYFGYMSRRKGLDLAISGFEKFLVKNPKSNYKLVLAGGTIKGQESSLQEILDRISRSKFSKKIIYKGFIEEFEQDKLYSNAYAVIIPAILSISTSGPLYHATSYGKCVLASKIGHFLEDVDDGKTGILVNNNKWDKAFEYIVKNPLVVKEIEKNTKRIAVLRSPINTAKKYVNLYQKVQYS